MTVSEVLPAVAGILEAGARTDRRLSNLAEFLTADAKASEAAERARCARSDVLDDEAERLYGEAEDAWMKVASGWAAGSFVPEDALKLGRGYEASRLRAPMPARAVSGDWHDPITVDWSRSRAAVAQ